MGMRILWLSPSFNPGLHPQVVFHGGNIPWYFRCILILSLFNMSWFSIHYFPLIYHYTMAIFHHIFHYIPIMVSIFILHFHVHYIPLYTYRYIYIYNHIYMCIMVLDLNSIYIYIYTYIYIYIYISPWYSQDRTRKYAAFGVDPGRDQGLGPGWGLQEPPPRITGRVFIKQNGGFSMIFLWKWRFHQRFTTRISMFAGKIPSFLWKMEV